MAQKEQFHPKINDIRYQRTFVMVKPDGVQRGLIGDIVSRLERVGLKVVAMKMIRATREQALKHYPFSDEAWIHRLGGKTFGTFDELELDKKEILGTDDQMTAGKEVAEALVEYLTFGPIVCMVVEGIQAIDMVRKLAGHTLPFKADVGTIRGDYSVDSPAIANVQKRGIHNVMHASENPGEAENEIKLWFTEGEIHDYPRGGEEIMYSRNY
jgi:nucleoside-diphosphate kinase